MNTTDYDDRDDPRVDAVEDARDWPTDYDVDRAQTANERTHLGWAA